MLKGEVVGGSGTNTLEPGLSGATRLELTDDGSGHLLVGNAGTRYGSALAPRFLAVPAPRADASVLQHAEPLMQAVFQQMLGGAAPAGTARAEAGALPDTAPAWHPVAVAVAVALEDRSIEHVFGLHHSA